jgi:leader peptidase (prepilin peptidase)/N-methyltransferase
MGAAGETGPWPLAAVGAVASLAASPDLAGLFGASLALLMAAIAAKDCRDRIIPDALTFTAAVVGLVRLLVVNGVPLHLAGVGDGLLRAMACGCFFLAVRFLYRRIRGQQGLGLGDVKLAAVGGLWLEWRTLPLALDVAALSALFAYVAWPRLTGRPVDWNHRLPFGAFLAAAIWAGWLFDTLLR